MADDETSSTRKRYRMGNEVFFADSEDEAIRVGTYIAAQQAGGLDRELGAGDITQRFPELRQVDSGSIYDPNIPVTNLNPQGSTLTGPEIGPLEAIFGDRAFTKPPLFGDAAVQGETPGPGGPLSADRILQAVQELGIGGPPPLLDPEQMPGSGYFPSGDLGRGHVDALAAVEQLLGTNPIQNPQMYLDDVSYISRSEAAARQQMAEDLGYGPGQEALIGYDDEGQVKTFEFTMAENMGLASRLSTFDMSPAALEDSINSVNKDIETKIIADPLRDTNQYLYAKRKDEPEWSYVNPGFMETLLAEGPTMAGEITGAALMSRFAPLRNLKGLANSVGYRMKRQAGRMATQALGGWGGGVAANTLQNYALDEYADVPLPTFEERKAKIAELAALSAGGEVLGRTVLAVPRVAISGPRRMFSREADTWKKAWAAHEELGGPRPLPAMFTANSMNQLTRIWNTTTPGQKDAVKRLQQGMSMFSKFRDNLGRDIVDITKTGLPDEDEGARLLARFNESLKRNLTGKHFRGTAAGDWKKRVGDTEKNYFSWMTTNMAIWAKKFDDLGTKLIGAGAKWDTAPIKISLSDTLKSRASIVGKLGDEVDHTIKGDEINAAPIVSAITDFMALPRHITDLNGYKTLRQLKTHVDNIQTETLNPFEREVLQDMRHSLTEMVFSPTTPVTQPGMRATMEKLQGDYKSFRRVDELIRAATIQGTFRGDATQIGRSLIDPINNPSMVTALREVFSSVQDDAGFEALRVGYIGDVFMNIKNTDEGLKMLQGGRFDPETDKALNILFGDPNAGSGLRKDLRGFLNKRSNLLDNKDTLTFMSDIENNGSMLLDIWDRGPRGMGEFNSVLAFLEDTYPGKGKEVAAWSVFSGVLKRMTTVVDGKLGLDKKQAGAILRQYRDNGLFDKLLNKKQMQSFDQAMANLHTIPGGAEFSTSMAGQELAGKGLKGNPFTAATGAYQRMSLVIHARVMIDALAGAPFGYGKHGLEGSVKSRYLLANTLNAMDKTKEYSDKYKPGSRRNMSINELLMDAKAKNQVLIYDVDAPADLPSSADIYAQALVHDQELQASRGTVGERLLRDPLELLGSAADTITPDFLK